MNLYLVSALQKNIVKKKFLVRSESHAAAETIVRRLNDKETAEGEPLYSADCYVNSEPVEFVEGVCQV